MSSPLRLKRTCCPATIRVLFCLLALILLVGTASAQFVSPPSGQYQLNGCRNTGTITLPSTNNAEGGGFVCPDAAYTSGNLGKGWNELDLVPFRLTTNPNATNPTTTVTYNIIIAGEFQQNGITGWDVIDSDNAIANGDLTGPTKNPNSDSSCSATWTAFSTNGPGLSGSDTSIFRTLQITQNTGTTCIWDYYMRIALGAHNFPGASLHGFKFNSADFKTGAQDVPLPVNLSLPPSLSKTMTAMQNQTIPWTISKTETPANVTIKDTCDPSSTLSQSVQVTITWTKKAAVPTGGVVIETKVYATNPSARSITANVFDIIYGGTNQANPLDRFPATGTISTVVPANTTNALVLTHDFTDNSGAFTSYNDIATATYTDTVTGIPIPEDTTASASATVQETTLNATATVHDDESISSTGDVLKFSVDSTIPAQPYGTFSCTLGSPTFACGWDSPTLSASGSVTFNKTISVPPKTSTTGDLIDQAKLTGSDGFQATSNKTDIGITANAFVTLNLTKNVTGLASGSQKFQFHVFGTTGINATDVGDPSLTFTAGQTQLSLTPALTGLMPDTYNVTEDTVTGWVTDPGETVDLNLPNCSGTVTLNNTQEGHIIVKKVTNPSSDTTTQFTFTPSYNSGTTFQLAGGGSNDSGALKPGSYSVSESTVAAGWDLASSSCDGTGNTPASITLGAAQTVTCTFTNTERGHIIVKKVTNPSSDTTTQFTFTPSYNGGTTFQMAGGGSNDSGALTPASYSVSESTVAAGWDLTSSSCDGTGNTPASITLGAGQTVTCTFTNTERGHIIVKKVTNPSSDTTTQFTFTPSYNGGTTFQLAGGGSNDSGALTPGSYSVSESTVAAGWDLTSSSCDGTGNTPASITLGAGQTVTCTFTNTERGHVIVKKVTNPSSDTTTQFTFTPSYNGGTTFQLAGGGSNDSGALTPGSYSVSESTVAAGWDLTSSSCDGTGNTPASITLGAGQTVTCTFTNTERGHVIVKKVSNPSSDTTT